MSPMDSSSPSFPLPPPNSTFMRQYSTLERNGDGDTDTDHPSSDMDVCSTEDYDSRSGSNKKTKKNKNNTSYSPSLDKFFDRTSRDQFAKTKVSPLNASEVAVYKAQAETLWAYLFPKMRQEEMKKFMNILRRSHKQTGSSAQARFIRHVSKKRLCEPWLVPYLVKYFTDCITEDIYGEDTRFFRDKFQYDVIDFELLNSVQKNSTTPQLTHFQINMSITSTPSILFAIKSLLKERSGPIEEDELPFRVPPHLQAQTRDDFFDRHVLSVDTDEARKDLEDVNQLTVLLAESLPPSEHRALILQFEHLVNSRMSLVARSRMKTSTVSMKMGNVAKQITRSHAGVILEPLRCYLYDNSAKAASQHSQFHENALFQKAFVEQYTEDHLHELANKLLPNLRESPRNKNEDKKLKRMKIKKRVEKTLVELETDGEVLAELIKQNASEHRGRKSKIQNTKMDAVLLPAPLSPNNDDLTKYDGSSRIFLENLPIDITEEELIDAVSFCGPVKSVSIFNQRPDLDPLNKDNPKMVTRKALDKVKKRKPKTPGFYSDRKEFAITKISPVYAMIDFEDESAVEIATQDNIRIFGLVIDKHSTTVNLAADYTTLYLEIPANVMPDSPLREPNLSLSTPQEYALELEMKLREMIGDSMYICMALGENEWAYPDTCEINFPSHELAMMAKDKIEAGMKDEMFKPAEEEAAYKFNLVRTRLDAIHHWRREVKYT